MFRVRDKNNCLLDFILRNSHQKQEIGMGCRVFCSWKGYMRGRCVRDELNVVMIWDGQDGMEGMRVQFWQAGYRFNDIRS